MPKTIEIRLPALHIGQQEVVDGASRFNVLECGRRFGKTTLGVDLIINTALDGYPAAWFAPTYKLLSEVWRIVLRILKPLDIKVNVQEHRIELPTEGVIEFWSLDQADPARGRKYKRVVIDEAGIIRDLEAGWQEAIRPTLADMIGDAWFLGTPKGRNYFHRLFAKGQTKENNWSSFRLPTTSNPNIDPEEIEAARRDMPESAFKQEFLGIPADDGGNPFDLSAIKACSVDGLANGPAVAFGVDLAKSYDWTWIIGLNAEGRVCVSERWQSDWGATRTRLNGMITAHALVDSTGVGDPIVEDLVRCNQKVTGFKFTSTSKQQIIEGLAAAIQRREIRFPIGYLTAELESFEYQYSAGGVKYSAPEGLHDDGVCALALAVNCLGNHVYRPRSATIDTSVFGVFTSR